MQKSISLDPLINGPIGSTNVLNHKPYDRSLGRQPRYFSMSAKISFNQDYVSNSASIRHNVRSMTIRLDLKSVIYTIFFISRTPDSMVSRANGKK